MLVDKANNRRLTTALFKELSVTPHIPTVFSIEEWRKVYVDVADPTGYRAMEILIGDWEHWKLIVSNQTIAPLVDEWNDEVNTKLRSEAVAHLRRLASTKDSAAKCILMGEWEPRKRGRPVKDRTKPEPSRVAGDAARLGL